MESGINNTPKILLISSVDPTKGPGKLGIDSYNAFKSQGYEIDLLTKYPIDGFNEFITVFNVNPAKFSLLIKKIWYKIYKPLWMKAQNGNCFFYGKETEGIVPNARILNKIEKKYDIVLVLFWQTLITATTIEEIYKKLKCQIIFMAVDYSPMTGGCHFPQNCERFQDSCGSCPALKSKNKTDFTNFNLLYRKNVYLKVKPIVLVNKYMASFFSRSTLFKNSTIDQIFPVINEYEFKPKDKLELRDKYGIPTSKTFIMFWGCQGLNDVRKGGKLLLQALDVFRKKLETIDSQKIILLIAGKSNNKILSQIPFDVKSFGYVTFDILSDLFSLSDLFLSPSIIDAGPMMVNQSLSCGTPVIAFEMGTALEVINNQGTGFCAKLGDSNDFADKMHIFYNLTKDKQNEMQLKCREIALKTTSYKSYVEMIIGAYKNAQSVNK
jgi:glycosyltransferase involved in cell wall biosynthesis